MKKLIIVTIICIYSLSVKAQVPYFAGTVGNGRLYGYTSLKIRPGINAMETYSCFQYGIGDHWAVGTDIYTGVESAYWGFSARFGLKISPYFNIGLQLTPSFDLNDNFKFAYATAAMYMNGNITKDGNLFWCSNTWWGINNGPDNTIVNWEYLGYNIRFQKTSLTPMIGAIHSWKFDQDVDLALGFYFSVSSFNIYLWGNDFFKSNPRIVVGVDFTL